MNLRLVCAIAFVTLALLLPSAAVAQSPAIVPVQGSLSDAAGAAINDTLPVTFVIYSDSTGAMSLWSETQDVTFEDGNFTAYLGTITGNEVDLTIFRDYPGLWMGIDVAGTGELPLFEIASVPWAGYAEYCGDAGTVDGQDANDLSVNIRQALLNSGDAHVRYSDAEAIAAMGMAADANTLNHDRYTDAEAVTAMGMAADANTLNHDRYTDAEAVTAMGVAADGNTLNHDRYTDGQAITATAASYLDVTGDTLTSGTISGVPDPVNDDEVANKAYVDAAIAAAVDDKFWYASVGLDDGSYLDKDGNTDTIVVPTIAGTVSCSTNNYVCIYHNTTHYVISILVDAAVPAENNATDFGNLKCWATAPGDNDWGTKSFGNGVQGYASDVNGGHDHCNVSNATTQAAGGLACLGLSTTGLQTSSHTTYGVLCVK